MRTITLNDLKCNKIQAHNVLNFVITSMIEDHRNPSNIDALNLINLVNEYNYYIITRKLY